jgi:hypothetical protein
VSVGFLVDVDERLRAINTRMNNFERDLCTTVDSILEVLGYVPSDARKQHQIVASDSAAGELTTAAAAEVSSPASAAVTASC